jgi:predicted TIM-barrel fold metal-dependent hydrolase
VSAGFAKAYNRWLRDYCAADPTRLHPVGVVSRHDVEMTLAELDRIIDYGFRGVVMRPEPILGLGLGDPRLEPFYWVLDVTHDLGVPVFVAVSCQRETGKLCLGNPLELLI